MKIFVISFACEPERPSEPGLGWSIVGELARRHVLTVLTRGNNREVIERYLAAHPGDAHAGIDWKYFDLPEWFHRLKKKLPGGIQLYHEIWQMRAAKAFGKTFSDYDIVHHLIFGGVFATPWSARYAKKFIWGPVGGALGAMEPAFLKNESRSSFWSEWFYGMVSRYSYSPLPFARKLRDRATAILFRTSELSKKLSVKDGQVTAVIPESAYEGAVTEKRYEDCIHPLRMVSIGRLVPLKGVAYAVRSFARYVREGGAGDYHVFGDGPLRHQLEELARREGVADKVVFHGNVPHPEVLRALKDCDVLLHGSFREGASWTILEGMANGLPVICQARAGMVDMVPDSCGTPIAAKTPDELVGQMSGAMMRYYQDPQLLREHGTMGCSRVRTVYTWTKIADALSAIYEKVGAM